MEIKKTMSIHEFDKYMNKKVKIQFFTYENENRIINSEFGTIVGCSLGYQTIEFNGRIIETYKPFICKFINENNQILFFGFDSLIDVEQL